jgi:hypothetical protein
MEGVVVDEDAKASAYVNPILVHPGQNANWGLIIEDLESGPLSTLGCRWKNIGMAQPTTGRQIWNSQLKSALDGVDADTMEAVFNLTEWKSFEIQDLTRSDMILSKSGAFWKPIGIIDRNKVYGRKKRLKEACTAVKILRSCFGNKADAENREQFEMFENQIRHHGAHFRGLKLCSAFDKSALRENSFTEAINPYEWVRQGLKDCLLTGSMEYYPLVELRPLSVLPQVLGNRRNIVDGLKNEHVLRSLGPSGIDLSRIQPCFIGLYRQSHQGPFLVSIFQVLRVVHTEYCLGIAQQIYKHNKGWNAALLGKQKLMHPELPMGKGAVLANDRGVASLTFAQDGNERSAFKPEAVPPPSAAKRKREMPEAHESPDKTWV